MTRPNAEEEKRLIDKILNEAAETKNEDEIFKIFEEIFNLNRSQTIKKFYHDLSLILHPDKNGHKKEAVAAFQLLGTFYSNKLPPSDNTKRNEEDELEAQEEERKKAQEELSKRIKEAEAQKIKEEEAAREAAQRLRQEEQERLKRQAESHVSASKESALRAAKKSQAALESPSETIANPAKDCGDFLAKKDGSRALLSYVRAHQKGDSSGLPKIKDIFDKIVQRKSALGVTLLFTQNPIYPLTKSELLEIINTKPQNLLQSEHGYDVITELLRASAEKLDLHDLLDIRKDLNDLLAVRNGQGDDGAKSCVAETNKIIEGKLRGILDEYVFKEAGIKIKTHDPSQTDGRIFELKFKVPNTNKVPSALQSFSLTSGLTYTLPGLLAKLGLSAKQGRRYEGSQDEAPITLPITEDVIRRVADEQQERIGDDLKLIQYALLKNGAISDPKNIKCLESHSGCRYQIKLETGQDPEESKQKISKVLGIDPKLCSIKGGEIEIAIAKTQSAEILKDLESERQKLKQCEILHSFLIEAKIDPDAVTFRKNDEGNFICSLKNSDENQKKIQPPFTLNPETEELELSVNSIEIKKVDERVQKLGFPGQPQHPMESLGRELTSQEQYRDAAEQTRTPEATRETGAPKSSSPHAEEAAAQKSPSSSPQPIECVSLLTRIKKFLGIDDKKSTKPVVEEWNEKKPSTTFKPTSVMELIKMVTNLFKGSGR